MNKLLAGLCASTLSTIALAQACPEKNVHTLPVDGFNVVSVVGPDQMDAFMKDKIKIYTQSAQALGLGKK